MASSTDTGEPDVSSGPNTIRQWVIADQFSQLFESLSRQIDPEKAALRDKEAEERYRAQTQRAEKRLGELVRRYNVADEYGLIR